MSPKTPKTTIDTFDDNDIRAMVTCTPTYGDRNEGVIGCTMSVIITHAKRSLSIPDK